MRPIYSTIEINGRYNETKIKFRQNLNERFLLALLIYFRFDSLCLID